MGPQAPHFWAPLGSATGAGTDRGKGDVSRWPVPSSSWDALLNTQWSSHSPGTPCLGPLLFAHVSSHVWGPHSALPVFLLSHMLNPLMGTTRCLSHDPSRPDLCSITSALCPACPTCAPCVSEGNVYLLGAAGHQALLQPESLFLRARLRMVVPHQAPLDLEMMMGGWGEGQGMWAGPCPSGSTLLRPPPSARRPRYAQGRCGRLGRCRSRGRT